MSKDSGPDLTPTIRRHDPPQASSLLPAIAAATSRRCVISTAVTSSESRHTDEMMVGKATDADLAKLREMMKEADIDALIVPSEDPHMSEYAPLFQSRREWVSGFTGSAGTAVITVDHGALLWTDGRYFNQALKELGEGWTLMRGMEPGVPTVREWLMKEALRTGIDPLVHTLADGRALAKGLDEVGGSLVALPDNLVDAVWGTARPPPPLAPLRVHDLMWAGETPRAKIERLHAEITGKGAGALLVTALDEVGWLLNLRGADVDFNPVFLSYVIISADVEGTAIATLYIDDIKLGPAGSPVRAHLEAEGVRVRPYEAAVGDVAGLAAAGVSLAADPKKVSYAFGRAIEDGWVSPAPETKRARVDGDENAAGAGKKQANKKAPKALIEMDSPVTLAKAIKNSCELDGMREAHLRDSVALARFFHWLEVQVAAGSSLDEVAISEHLLVLRQRNAGFIEPSFPTIAGADANGAVIHYRPIPGPDCLPITKDTMLLVDSGGQYDCGTTDVTRTVHFGTPSEKQRRCFTAVLKGHIALDRAVFPSGTAGLFLDTFARAPVWALGLNYRHGTGHGVGAAMNVHEGPMSISPRLTVTQGLKEHMVCSNEPGYYEDGAFGIRMENLFIIRKADTEFQFDPAVNSLTCENLTWHPIQRKLLDRSMLSTDEIAWIDRYHRQVWEKVEGRLEAEDAEVRAWLERECAAL